MGATNIRPPCPIATPPSGGLTKALVADESALADESIDKGQALLSSSFTVGAPLSTGPALTRADGLHTSCRLAPSSTSSSRIDAILIIRYLRCYLATGRQLEDKLSSDHQCGGLGNPRIAANRSTGRGARLSRRSLARPVSDDCWAGRFSARTGPGLRNTASSQPKTHTDPDDFFASLLPCACPPRSKARPPVCLRQEIGLG